MTDSYRPRCGRVGYINCLPVFYAIEEGHVQIPARLYQDHPSRLNRLMAEGSIELSAVSSAAYAWLHDSCLILPDMSISSNGPVWSVALLSRVPIHQLGGRKISLTPHSGTSIMLLKILLQKYYRVTGQFFTRPPGTSPWWGEPAATLVIGDEALKHTRSPQDAFIVYDLGEEWKRLTGKAMVFSISVVRRSFALLHRPELEQICTGVIASREWGSAHMDRIIKRASHLTSLPEGMLADYYRKLHFGFDGNDQEGLETFFAYAAEAGLIQEGFHLEIWGQTNEAASRSNL
jgi:chorismate dehydratase